jgi:hypothetical protein
VAKEGEYRGLLITAAQMGRRIYLEKTEEKDEGRGVEEKK